MDKATQSFSEIALLPDKWDHNKHFEKLIANEVPADDPMEKKLWREHSKYDELKYYNELKSIYSKFLSSNIKLKRLVFWRYLMVYRK